MAKELCTNNLRSCCDESGDRKAPTIIQMQQILSNDDYFNSVAELFKVLGDPTRAKIIHCLQSSELCVCDIAEMLGHDTLGGIAPAQGAPGKQAGKVQTRRKNGVLFTQ
jgi:hypothetical protein